MPVRVPNKDVKCPYDYNGAKALIERGDSIKYLGALLQNNRSWKKHINGTIAKASQIFGLIKYTLVNAQINLKKLDCYSLCSPILEYDPVVWDPYQENQIHRLEVFQNKILRFSFNLRGRYVSLSDVCQKKKTILRVFIIGKPNHAPSV